MVVGGLCGIAMGIVAPHARAQAPVYAPAAPAWSGDGVTGSMVLTPITARLGIGVPEPTAKVQILGNHGQDVTSSPGVGYLVLGDHTGTLGDQTGVHMKLDRNDIQVAGPSPETVLSLNLQRYGGPIVVHGDRPMSERVYLPFEGGLGVGTANPHLYAVSQSFMRPEWPRADSEFAVDGWIYSDISFANEVRVMDRLRVGRRGYPGAAWDDRASDALVMVAGKLAAQEIIVHIDHWADDVFDEDYPLPTLAEVEEFVREEHHLPGVPSGAEIEASGMDVASTNATLLRKVEELTLYMIEQDKRIMQLERELAELREQQE